VRFIIYKEEFVSGKRTPYLREPLFADENEAVARRKQRELFEAEVHRYKQVYWNVETAQQGEILIVRAPDHDRFVGVGLMDELRRETQLVADGSLDPR
jgi:hypothetical protein